MVGAACHWKRYVQEKKKIKMLRDDTFPCEEEYKKQLELCKREFGIRKQVELVYSYSLPVPIVSGILKPIIIIPGNLYTNQELEIILKHECMHIRHHDLLWKQCCQIIQLLHWWNPIVNRLTVFLDEWTEAYCDFNTCEYMESRKKYFTVIMRIGTADFSFHSHLCSALYENENGLKKRILRMKQIGSMNRAKTFTMFSVCICFLLSTIITLSAVTVGFDDLYLKAVWATATYSEEGVEYIPIEYQELHTGCRNKVPQKIQKLDIESVEDEYISFQQEIGSNSRGISKKLELKKGQIIYLWVMLVDSFDEEETKAIDSIGGGKKESLSIGLIDENGYEWYSSSEMEIDCKVEIPKNGSYQIFIDNFYDENVKTFGTMDELEEEDLVR